MFGGWPYRSDFVRSDRFATTERNGVLNRKAITDQLIERVDKAVSLCWKRGDGFEDRREVTACDMKARCGSMVNLHGGW
jgi:hypothetical protein